MRTVTRTIYGAAMQTALFANLPYNPPSNTTLNERFEVADNEELGDDERPYVGYYVIGNGGHQYVTGANGIPRTLPQKHQATDASCYKPIPFVMRELDNDLSATDRKNYALRALEVHDGVEYATYYAKRLDLDNVEVNMQRVKIEDGEMSEEPFEPDNDNLNPEPYDAEKTELVESSGEFVAGFALVTISFTPFDAEELRHVAKVLYGDENYAIISEIGFVSGVDRELTVRGDGGSTFDFKEVIGAQIVSFVSTNYQLNLQNQGFDFSSNIGIAEPLYTEESI